MTDGERFVDHLPRKRRFYDRNERRSYEMTRAVAARLIDVPDLVRNGICETTRRNRGLTPYGGTSCAGTWCKSFAVCLRIPPMGPFCVIPNRSFTSLPRRNEKE
jgi:hypothetical protein